MPRNGLGLNEVCIVDITDRTRAEKALRNAHDELERRVEIRTAELNKANKLLQEENEGRKRSEEALRESDKRLNSILDATTETIVLFDREGIVHAANQTVCDRLGTTKEEFIGKRIYDFFPPDVAEGRRSKWNEVFDTGKPVSFEDSREGMIFAQRAYPIFDDGGQVEMVTSFANDKTDRKQAEEGLRESEEKYRNLVEESFDGIFIQKGPNIIFANKRLNEMLGYGEGELLGQNHWVVYHPDFQKLTRERAQARMGGKKVVPRYEVKLQRKDGACFYGEINARPITFPSNQENGIQVWVKDIDERKQAEEDRNRLQNQLRQAQKLESIGTLAGGIAHDFNNILSSIMGYTELALDDAKKGTLLEGNLQAVYGAGERAIDLVKQILAFARQSNEERKPTRVATIAEEALKFIRSVIPSTIEIRKNLESNSMITGNATQVHQLFMNLCTNAAHAMEDSGGILEVGLVDIEVDVGSPLMQSDLKPGNYIKISVSDTGSGIDPDMIDSIFEPYFTTKGVGKGTGMGLALVYGIVESYSGKITVKSELGKGTTFCIFLPPTKKRGYYQPDKQGELPSGDERILLIDDELTIAKMGSQILERLGYHVTVRTSSVEALELFRSKPNDFDLVITDMTMPNLTGDKLAVELMKIRSDIPVILCTGYSKKISAETASEIGIKGFAYKPVVKVDLAKIVRKVLDETKSPIHQ